MTFRLVISLMLVKILKNVFRLLLSSRRRAVTWWSVKLLQLGELLRLVALVWRVNVYLLLASNRSMLHFGGNLPGYSGLWWTRSLADLSRILKGRYVSGDGVYGSLTVIRLVLGRRTRKACRYCVGLFVRLFDAIRT